ncbi:HAD-IIB family hydrolase [Profundibacterium mesophilum]|uniref:HAD-IIB family hydrolase n=1 Tax=Profundibacterium mesophilum TaxID=1258573 RepID=UPI001F3A2900|nr:HAD-IIB family hydrolase [Profundibacterium mesophilum]
MSYGLTEDTGGHIAYVLGAAMAQVDLDPSNHVDIVTRAFDAPELGAVHAQAEEAVADRCRILRLRTERSDYLSKSALEAELPALRRAFCDMLAAMPRRPDVLHAHFADAADLARHAGTRFGIPVVYTPHSLGIDKGACGHRDDALEARIAAEAQTLRASDAIIVSSRDEAERQVESYGIRCGGRVHCIAPGSMLTETDAAGTSGAEARIAPFLRDLRKPMILAIARPVHKKNLVALVQAYASNPALRDRANLVICAGLRDGIESGNAEQREVITGLLAAMDRHDLYGHMALPRRHSPSDVVQLYRLAAQGGGVFVNPALHEPFGLTLIEAARFGLPVVATDRGGPADIVERIGHGVTVDPQDHAAIGAAIERLIGDRAAWSKAARAGKERAGLYDWTRYAARSVALYARLCGKSAPRPRLVPRSILASDIDATLTGSASGAARFSAWARERSCGYVVATGRSIGEAQRVLAEWDLPRPDTFITSVGTEIWSEDPKGRLTLDMSYAEKLDAAWPRAELLRAIADLSEDFAITPQAPLEQREWKLSYFGSAASALLLDRTLEMLRFDVRVIASHGRFIDVMPRAAGKANAVAHVAARLGLDLSHCIAAGDSGNDRDMLMACGHAIVPANALPELDDLPSGPRLLRTAERHADGVLEGLARIGRMPRPMPRFAHGDSGTLAVPS